MELVKKLSTDENVQDALRYIKDYFRSIERVRMFNGVELSVTSVDRLPLTIIHELLGGRVQHRKENSRWYIRPSCPSYTMFHTALKEAGWTGALVRSNSNADDPTETKGRGTHQVDPYSKMIGDIVKSET